MDKASLTSIGREMPVSAESAPPLAPEIPTQRRIDRTTMIQHSLKTLNLQHQFAELTLTIEGIEQQTLRPASMKLVARIAWNAAHRVLFSEQTQ
jgi:hypothetical protein